MALRTLGLVSSLAIVLAAAPARADVALGLFVGEPTAIDLKLGFDRRSRSALDLAFGIDSIPRDYGYYFHATYLYTVLVARGDAVNVPLRIGIGGAIFDAGNFNGGVRVAARAPIELGLRFRRAPIEIYGELSLLLVVVDPERAVYLDPDGGVGLRVYF